MDPLFAVDAAIDDNNGVTDDCVELKGVSYKYNYIQFYQLWIGSEIIKQMQSPMIHILNL